MLGFRVGYFAGFWAAAGLPDHGGPSRVVLRLFVLSCSEVLYSVCSIRVAQGLVGLYIQIFVRASCISVILFHSGLWSCFFCVSASDTAHLVHRQQGLALSESLHPRAGGPVLEGLGDLVSSHCFYRLIRCLKKYQDPC